MGTDVEPHVFFNRADPQSDAHMERLGQHIGHGERKDDRDNHSGNLNGKLGRIAKKQSVGTLRPVATP